MGSTAGLARVAVALLLALGAGCGPSGSPTGAPEGTEEGTDFSPPGGSDEQADLEAEAEEHLQLLVEAYATGSEGACDDVWSRSPDGDLYYDGTAYTVADCQAGLDGDEDKVLEAVGALDAADALASADESDAETAGAEAGYDAAFEQTADVLCWGEDCVTRGDF